MDESKLTDLLNSIARLSHRNQVDRGLVASALGLLAFTGILHQFFPGSHLLQAGFLFVAILILALYILRMSKRAIPEGVSLETPISSAIKGLLPFTEADGKLFSNLGRNLDLQKLVGLAQNRSVTLIAVRGKSGVGKTSLLLAGVVFSLDKSQCIYWEATPANTASSLLHAIHSLDSQVDSLDAFPSSTSSRCVLIFDQFEQLQPHKSETAQVYELIKRIVSSSNTRTISIIVAFREEFTSDWLDFEKEEGLHAEHVHIKRLAPSTARDVFVTLAAEGGLSLDNALVDSFIRSVSSSNEVSPLDIGIGVLSLANLAQGLGLTHVSNKDYSLAGGHDGLLFSFVKEQLELIPEHIRLRIIKGAALCLIDPLTGQRLTTGLDSRDFSSAIGLPEPVVSPWLERLAHPRVRLLERISTHRYRLSHDRLGPAIQRLAGDTLDSDGRLKIKLQREIARWQRERDSRFLMSGRDLNSILSHPSRFIEPEDLPRAKEYLGACRKRRLINRALLSSVLLILTAISITAAPVWRYEVERSEFVQWGVNPALLTVQNEITYLEIRPAITDLRWLTGRSIENLTVHFTGYDLSGLAHQDALRDLTMDLDGSQVKSLRPLVNNKQLERLTLLLAGSKVDSLDGIEQMTRLDYLAIDISRSRVSHLASLSDLKQLHTLYINSDSLSFGVEGVSAMPNLRSLSLYTRGTKILDLHGLHRASNLDTLNVWMNSSDTPVIYNTEELEHISTLSLNFANDNLADLTMLTHAAEVKDATIYLSGAKIGTLRGIEGLHEVVHLALNVSGTSIDDLSAVRTLSKLKSLDLTIDDSQLDCLSALNDFQGLLNLSIYLTSDITTDLSKLERIAMLNSLDVTVHNSALGCIKGLDALSHIKNLSLDLDGASITQLPDLSRSAHYEQVDLRLRHTLIENLDALPAAGSILRLQIDYDSTRLKNVSAVNAVNGLRFLELDTTNLHKGDFAQLKSAKSLRFLTVAFDRSEGVDLGELNQSNDLEGLSFAMPAGMASELQLLHLPPKLISLALISTASESLTIPNGFSKVSVTCE